MNDYTVIALYDDGQRFAALVRADNVQEAEAIAAYLYPEVTIAGIVAGDVDVIG